MASKYMIHTYPGRKWYVDGYLIPSMEKQGIDRSDIAVWNDVEGKGTLIACMESFSSMPNDDFETWHLQDDVVISEKFAEVTDVQYGMIVNGFCGRCDRHMVSGIVQHGMKWLSFPCICIPNKLALECGTWFFDYAIHKDTYQQWIAEKRSDDTVFQMFVNFKHPNIKALNLDPNIVEHVDWLIGGSTWAKQRKEVIRSLMWEDRGEVDDLKRWLDGNTEIIADSD